MISVVIPLYNKEAIVERSVRSILSQDYDDFEVVIVNDGSTDKSAEIVKAINDPRITLIEQENGGPSKARNTGVKHAKGDWILFLDADDELLPEALITMASELKNNDKFNFVAFPYYIKTNEKVVLADYTNKTTLKNPYKSFFYSEVAPRMGSFICVRELAVENLFDEEIRRYEDDEMLLRMYRSANIKYCAKPLMISNSDFASASSARPNISEDFLGHLNFKNKGFWERMCLYKLFLGERPHYSEQCRKLYPQLYYRIDLMLIYKILMKLK